MKPNSVFLNLGGFTFSGSHKEFQICQICGFYFLLDRCFFFNFQFCDDHILDFIESEHIIMKQSLPIYIIFDVKYTEI